MESEKAVMPASSIQHDVVICDETTAQKLLDILEAGEKSEKGEASRNNK